jgi:hypothetical protein
LDFEVTPVAPRQDGVPVVRSEFRETLMPVFRLSFRFGVGGRRHDLLTRKHLSDVIEEQGLDALLDGFLTVRPPD